MSGSGRVSRASPVQTAVRNCTRDEGGPFEAGSQVLASSHRKLDYPASHSSAASVVDKGSSLTLALSLARKMRAIHKNHRVAMTILTVRHITTYQYKQPVSFGEHRMMLRPRESHDQRLLESKLEITPKPTNLRWIQDAFGNHVAIARFVGRAEALRFDSTIRLDHSAADIVDMDIKDFARAYPFIYATPRRGLSVHLAWPSVAMRIAFRLVRVAPLGSPVAQRAPLCGRAGQRR